MIYTDWRSSLASSISI